MIQLHHSKKYSFFDCKEGFFCYSSHPNFDFIMKKDIHPQYSETKAVCSCGNNFTVMSTMTEDLSLDICSACHPFYTGKQKIIDTGGRVQKFEERFGKKK